VVEGPCISERRRLCDAKTQITIPGAQPSSSIRAVLFGTSVLSRAKPAIARPDLHSLLVWNTISPYR
jgi:hypothetical protein